MIKLNFGLFWSGTRLSYLRYLTFKSLRHFHPDAKIQLYVSTKCDINNCKWLREKQDFQKNKGGKDYVDELDKLDVQVIKADLFPTYAPNYQSDLFRYWYLYNHGGFYLDTDQIIVKSFENLPLNKDLIYSAYHNPQCGMYYPVGVLGASKESKFIKYIMEIAPKYHDPNDYNSMGPWMFRSVYESKKPSNSYNAPHRNFYPILMSDLVNEIYSGRCNFTNKDDIFAVHWFGGHLASQKFNKKYTEEFAKTSSDSISKTLRDLEII